jgi:hypothetical protein
MGLAEQLPHSLQTRWHDTVFKLKKRHERTPGLLDFVTFVERAGEKAADIQSYGKSTARPGKAGSGPTAYSSTVVDHCPLCNEDGHGLHECEAFIEEKPDARHKTAMKLRLCFVCLVDGHMTRECPSKVKCTVTDCGRRHHTLLHGVDWQAFKRSGRKKKEGASKPEPDSTPYVGYHSKGDKVALPLLPVRISSKETGKSVNTFALLDSGSNVTLCQDGLLEALGVKGRKEVMRLTTLEKVDSLSDVRVASLSVSDLRGDCTLDLGSVRARSELHISHGNRVTEEEVERWPHLRELPLHHAESHEVTLLIGQDCPEALIPLSIVAGGKGEPYAIRTRLGWTVSGPVSSSSKPAPAVYFQQGSTDQLLDKVSKFWQVDSSGLYDQTNQTSVQDRGVLERWRASASHTDGHYTLPIPFRDLDPSLPDNRCMAERRLASLARKLRRHEGLRQQYVTGMEELIEKGYAEEIPQQEPARSDGRVWYLPHHPVVNPNKDKPRIVFDCAAEHGGTSLNNKVLQGPDLTNKLLGVLLRFRLHQVAIMADVEAMFHQVRVARADQDVLRFLWWPGGDLSKRPSSYRMTVHLFGGTWSPSCCTYALHRTVTDQGQQYSLEAQRTVLRNFYVDDCLKSVATEKEAVALVAELKGMVAHGGFNLTKWTSNSPAVLRQIPAADHSKKIKERALDAPLEDRALGVYWHVEADRLGFKAQIMDKPLTKRGVLSMLSSVYDPLGMAGPFVLRAKLIMQDLCREKMGWDDSIKPQHEQRWRQWTTELPEMTQLRVPRCIQPSRSQSRQFHHFADASQKAYGVVSYLRTVDMAGQVSSTLVMAKSRLAPIKELTVPRLELQAATLATRQDALLRRELGEELELDRSQYWTDSTIVLQYIRNRSARYHTFVANRVTEIQDRSDDKDWHHVPSAENPADDASRGVDPEALRLERWLEGPDFLKQTPDRWPRLLHLEELSPDNTEVKREKPVVFTASIATEESPLDKLIEGFSNWTRLLRAIACFLVLADIERGRAPLIRAVLPEHMKRAEEALIAHLQGRRYGKELKALRQNQRTATSSPLYRLGPRLKGRLIVVGGRLSRAPIAQAARSPVVVPPHEATRALIRYVHERTGHSGREYVLAELQQQYYIPGARSIVRKILNDCVVCRKRAAKPCSQLEADLPADRVCPGDPAFSSVGIDYFGPILVRRGRGREKKYGCLFTCLVTRAVHIEVADKLDVDSFLNCLHRFMARRGAPKLIRSDNGTNFVGAERELRREMENWDQERVQGELTEHRIRWLFNPPAASHMGGVWERQIRTVKRVLAGLTREQVLTHEMLVTLLVMAEGIVNNRPLTPVSDDPSDLEALTPNHLLIHRPSTTPPGLFGEQDLQSRRKWKQVQYLSDLFWRRWTKEYLPLLRQRTKWHEPQRNVGVGDMVLVLERQLPRSEWPVGRVCAVYEGTDGFVRSAKVRTVKTEMIRPIVKLCLLEESPAKTGLSEPNIGCEGTTEVSKDKNMVSPPPPRSDEIAGEADDRPRAGSIIDESDS